jgi:hypothetical protein
MITLALTLYPPRVRLIRGQAYRAADIDDAIRESYIGQLTDPDALLMAACANKARSLAARRGWRTRRREGVRK